MSKPNMMRYLRTWLLDRVERFPIEQWLYQALIANLLFSFVVGIVARGFDRLWLAAIFLWYGYALGRYSTVWLVDYIRRLR